MEIQTTEIQIQSDPNFTESFAGHLWIKLIFQYLTENETHQKCLSFQFGIKSQVVSKQNCL